MESNFSSEFFIGNRQRLRKLFVGSAPIVITASGLLQKSADSTYPFHQDSSFWYLTGISEPDIVLVIDRDREYLIVPPREHSREIFDGAIDETDLTAISGVESVLDAKAGWKQLGSRLKRVKHVATLAAPVVYNEHHGMYTNPARAKLITKLKELAPEASFLDLRPHLTKMRSIKQPLELAAIQQAIDITSKSLKPIVKNLDKYNHEYEIEAALTQGFRKRGAQHGFSPIVAASKHACTLHYISNNGEVNGAGIVLDVGAELNHYTADISRSYPLGKASKRYRDVYQAVLEVHQFAMGLLKPGILMKDYELQVLQSMGEKLRELGLIKSIENDRVRQFYPHATSHSLGLDAHDVFDYENPLQSGMVLTVEPGIYIPKEGIGVRIEDDVLVTADGVKVLSDNLPRELS